MVGYALELVCSTESWLPMAVGTLAVFPLVLLGALAADGAWVPLAIGKTLQSFFLVGGAWGLFYLETTPMIAGWALLVKDQLAGQGRMAGAFVRGAAFGDDYLDLRPVNRQTRRMHFGGNNKTFKRRR